MLKSIALVACFAWAPVSAMAQEALAKAPEQMGAPAQDAAQDDGVRILDTVQVVAGHQPGPRMWKVRKGDHVLHVLAVVTPLPKDITWDSAQVEGVISRSQAYITAPYLGISADVGFFGGLHLLPAYMRLRKNPDGATLQQVLSPDLYRRWSAAKARYLPGDEGVEKMRPIIAAEELYDAALKRSGLGGKPKVSPVIDAAVKRHGLKRVSTAIQVKLDDPKKALKEVQAGGFDDAKCLRETLDNIEYKLPDVIRQANAWATGDVAALRTRSARQGPGCLDALVETDFARKHGIRDVPQRLRANWTRAAEDALASNPSTFAVLPLESVVGPDNYLDALRAKGYEVIAP